MPTTDRAYTGASTPLPRVATVLLPIGVFALAAVAAYLRLPAVSRDTFWAEDARTFSERALNPDSLPWSVFTSYDGYVHVLPQATAWVMWHVLPIPVEHMAKAFTIASCLIAAAVAVGIFLLTAAWGLNLLGRLLLAFTTVLVPGLSYEVLGNLANVHWFLLWLAPFLFLCRPRRWWTSGLVGVIAFVVISSEVQAILFAPLLLWKLTDRRRWPIFAGAFLGGLVQGIAVLGGGRQTWGTGLPTVVSILDGYAMQVPLLGLAGTGQSASTIVAYSGWAAAFAALTPFVISAIWWSGRSRRRTLVSAGLLVASLAIWTAGYALNMNSAFDFSTADRATLLAGVPLLRYAIVPLMLLFATVGLAVGSVRLTARGFQRATAIAVAAMCVICFAVNYRVEVPTLRSVGPTWTEGLAQARLDCTKSASESVEIPIAPVQYWTFTIDCERIAR